MKDHELKKLINDVTVAAKTYVHTQQLREQIAHLIVSAFSWHPIETAPRDGTHILLCDMKEIHEGWFVEWHQPFLNASVKGWCVNWNNEFNVPDVTIKAVLWKHLPSLPKTKPPTPSPSSDNTP